MDASLIVVAKRPEPGFTKTRLCPPFTPAEAAQFYRCLMLDTLELVSRLQGVAHALIRELPARDALQLRIDLGKELRGRVVAARCPVPEQAGEIVGLVHPIASVGTLWRSG